MNMQKTKLVYPNIESSGSVQSSPLSFQQERVLYLNKLSANGPLWNRVSCKRLIGKLDEKLLEQAVADLVERHAALRTRIDLINGEPRQSRHERLKGAFSYIDLSAAAESLAKEQAMAILNREYEQPLSLEGGELFKSVVVRCSEAETWLILKLHHIISDATTIRILWSDLKVLYNSRLGDTATLGPLDLEYFDYATWLRKQFVEDNTRPQESFWLGQFRDGRPELDLPTDHPEPPNLTFNGSLERQLLPRSLVKRVQAFSFGRRVIPFSTMLSAYYLLLHNYCRQHDITVGTVFSGRHYSPKIKALAGFFTNTVAIPTRLDPSQTVTEFVKGIHAQVTQAYEMQDYPFERLVNKLDPDRERKRNPLFRALFNMMTEPEEIHRFKGVHTEQWMEPEIRATQVDLFLELHIGQDESELRLEYNTDLFSRTRIQRMLRHYVTLVEKMVEAPDQIAYDLSMLDEAEEKRVLRFGEGESELRVCERSVIELLEDRAARTPNEVALLFGDDVMTCGEVNTRVNQLAATLIDAGVREGDVVAIVADRSPEMVLGLLAILKAGSAYLPIDPAFPAQRTEFILRDSGVRCLLVQNEPLDILTRTNGTLPLKCISLNDKSSYRGAGENFGRKINLSNAAYVIYTSGSTGKPKGVVVEHKALMNTLEFLQAKYPLTKKTILLKTNFTFDVSCTELFGWLFDGRLALLEKEAEKDPAKLLNSIAKFGVTHINFVPSMLDVFLSGLQERDISTLERLEYVFVAGEAIKPDLAKRFHQRIRGVRLENLYGPTEAAIYATWYSIPRTEELNEVPIGRPLSNTQAYILDEQLRLRPVGLLGELCLSGAGLARGYLNAPELTNEKFCPNPHRKGERIYRTGDLAKWSDDGLIRFSGRADGQVKIRGFRVELGEVERKLRACHGVMEAAVTARADQFGQKGLVAYFTTETADKRSVEDLRKELATWLPSYMVPDVFVKIDRLPRLASGKIDLQALPEPGQMSLTPEVADRVAPTPLEQTIITIVEQLLNTTGLGPESNFFRLGGNSLLTLRFIATLDATLGTNLSPMDFLSLPTIAEIARLIEPAISPATRSGEVVIAKGAANCCAREPVRNSLEEVRA